jgi:hypothetical protein
MTETLCNCVLSVLETEINIGEKKTERKKWKEINAKNGERDEGKRGGRKNGRNE